jgi:putative ABC transport system ATP-binding protein
LRIGDGDFVAIRGPSGSGKSTLLQIVGLLDRPTSGVVLLDGRDLGDLGDAERTRLRLETIETIGFVFQRFHLLRELTAVENVALPMEAAGVPVRERYARAADLLTSVGLGARLVFRPAQLSGGQRQRVAIARALANEPRLILAEADRRAAQRGPGRRPCPIRPLPSRRSHDRSRHPRSRGGSRGRAANRDPRRKSSGGSLMLWVGDLEDVTE